MAQLISTAFCRRNFLSFIGVGVCCILLLGCAANPVTGKRELALISTAEEIELGEQNYALSQQAEGALYTVDSILTEYVRSVGQRVAAVSERKLPYEFVVLNNSIPNAWALPGGKIAINRGLLVELDNEAELAAVLGHEVVHAAARHGALAQQRALLFDFALQGVALASGNSKYVNYIVGGANLALQLTSHKYGRNAESISDYHGMKYMHAAGYDTNAAVTLQEKFVALSEGRKTHWLEGLFASHPPSPKRVDKNRETLATFPAGGEVGRDRYCQQLAYLRARQDAYEQADHARQLLDTNSHAALQAINAAIKQEAKEPLFYGIKGDILAYQQRYQEAVREYDNAIKRDQLPGYYEHFLGRGLAYNHIGQTRQAQTDLERSNQLLPTAVASYQLGNIALANDDRAQAKRLFADASAGIGEVNNVARKAFVKLDLADTPSRYVNTYIIFAGNQVVIEVQNATAYALRDIVIGVDVTINGAKTSHKLSLPRLAANYTKALLSGVRYREKDDVEVATDVLRATAAY